MLQKQIATKISKVNTLRHTTKTITIIGMGIAIVGLIGLNGHQRAKYEGILTKYNRNKITLEQMFVNGQYGVDYSYYIEDVEGIKRLVYTDGSSAVYDTVNGKYTLYLNELEPLGIELKDEKELNKWVENYLNNTEFSRKIRLHKAE